MSNLRDADILRGPLQVAFDITNKCNFRCLHCYNDSGENHVIDNELSDDEVKALMHDVGKMQLLNVCFCGGEPLLRVDLLCECAKILKSYGVKFVSIVTNGYLVTEELVKKMLDSGIDSYQLSLDGISSKSHDLLRNKQGSYDKVMNAIQILKRLNIKNLDIAFSCTNFNLEELKDAYYLCNEFGIDHFRTQPLMIIGRATKNEEKIALNHLQYRKYVKIVHELKQEYLQNKNLKTKVEFADPVDHIIRGKQLGPVNYMTTIRANGDIAVSPYLPLTVGNIRDHSIKQYWDNGLNDIWNFKMIKEMSERVISATNFGNKDGNIPNVWIDEDIKVDLIDEVEILHGDTIPSL